MKYLLVTLLLPLTIFASELVFQFKSPTFTGVGYSAHQLTLEQISFNRKKAIEDEIQSAELQAQLPFGFIEIGMGLGFLGLFVLSVLKYLEQKPGATLSDPIMYDDPEHIEIHVSHGHH